MWDAVFYACREKLMKDTGAQSGRRFLVLLSDHDDNQSHVRSDEALKMAQAAGVTVYAIDASLGKNDSSDAEAMLGRANFIKLAEATGGRALAPKNEKQLQQAFDYVKMAMESQFSLSYRVPDIAEDGSFHTVEIKASDSKLKVRAQKGYYAPKSSQH